MRVVPLECPLNRAADQTATAHNASLGFKRQGIKNSGFKARGTWRVLRAQFFIFIFYFRRNRLFQFNCWSSEYCTFNKGKVSKNINPTPATPNPTPNRSLPRHPNCYYRQYDNQNPKRNRINPGVQKVFDLQRRHWQKPWEINQIWLKNLYILDNISAKLNNTYISQNMYQPN